MIIEYLDYSYRCKPVDKLVIAAAIEEATTNGNLSPDELERQLSKFSKGLRNKLILDRAQHPFTIHAEKLDGSKRATLYKTAPDWAKTK